jgi:hypothetical protein
MKAALVILAIILGGCVHSSRDYITAKEEIMQVIRLTEERDAGYRLRHFEPSGSPVFYADIHFRVEAPEVFRGREIVLPIIKDTEGPLFQRSEFTIKIPACFLDGKLRSEIKSQDDTTQIMTYDGVSFEGLVVEPAIKSSTAQHP